jgi:hypothetical protein
MILLRTPIEHDFRQLILHALSRGECRLLALCNNNNNINGWSFDRSQWQVGRSLADALGKKPFLRRRQPVHQDHGPAKSALHGPADVPRERQQPPHQRQRSQHRGRHP